MLESDRQWEFFGYDMRNVYHAFATAWRNFIWEPGSPVRHRLDEAVRVRSETGEYCYHDGQPSAALPGDCSAVLLPDELVLGRTLQVPEAVESELHAVIALEVSAHSPFPGDDTAYGWRVLSREGEQLTVALVIASSSAVMTYLGREYDIHDAAQEEVWAAVDGEVVVLQGFGEVRRNRRFRERLLRVAMWLGLSSLLCLAILAAGALFKSAQLHRYEGMSAELEARSSTAAALRAELLTANDLVAAANEFVRRHPAPHREISRLTDLFDDGTSVERFEMNGLDIEIRGRASDAASIMQTLSAQDAYAEVSAPRAISRAKGSEQDYFHLNIKLREVAEP